MRRLLLTITLAATVGLLAGLVAAPAGAGSGKPKGVNLSGKVNVKGTTDVRATPSPTLSISETDFAISPTFIRVKAGQVLTLDVKNSGQTTHTFTSKKLGVDQRLDPGQSAQLQVTIPSKARTIQFFCSLHRSMGMKGAVYTGAKGSRGGAKTGTSPDTKSGGSGGYDYGY